MLYENYETEISKDNLVTVFSKVTKPLCLLGGWAVYLTVNENYKNDKGRDYHGSKDIDLGFHFSNNESEEALKNSAFNQSIKALEEIGFYSVGFRLVQHYHRETKKILTPEEAKKIRLYDIFDLYVDLMVDNIPNNIKNILGITPADEKLLELVFEKGGFTEVDEFGVKILLPKPEVLLSTKLISLPRRTKDHKKWKDIADIYSLMWYSGIKLDQLKSGVLSLLSQKDVRKAFSQIEDSDYEEASNAIGVSIDEMKNVINSFIVTTSSKNMDSTKNEDASDEKWRIPINVSFDTLKIILNTLYRKQADQKSVTLDELAKTSGLHKTALNLSMYFFKSIKIVDGDVKTGFKFTDLGIRYTKALALKNTADIQSTTKEIVKNSHIKDFIDYIQVHDDNVTLNDLFQYLRTESRAPSGPSTGGMSQPYASGARALLMMLDHGGVLPEKISSELQSRKKSDSKRSIQRVQKQPTKMETEVAPDIEPKLQEGTLGRITVDGVGYVDIRDDDTLELAKSYLDIVKKKLSAKNIE